MRLPSIIVARERPAAAPSEGSLLDRDHPYLRASRALAAVRRQWLAVALVLAGAVASAVSGVEHGLSLAFAAGVVLAGLTALLAALRARRRQRAIELLLDGYEALPLPAVQHERERLLDRRTRLRLSASLEDLVDQATARGPMEPLGGGPIYRPRVVAALAEDLLGIAALLRADVAVGVRGVASVERLLTDGCSALYGRRSEPLCEELHRIRYLLETPRHGDGG